MSADESSPETAEPTKDECLETLHRVYEFLDDELDTATGDTIRAHLAACEPCMDHYDVELAIKTLVHRSCGGDLAPDTLRAKVIVQLGIARQQLR